MAACGVSYTSLALSTFGISEAPREAVAELASKILKKGAAEKVEELINCPFCVSFYCALIVTRGRPVKALQLAGLAALPTAVVLLATKD